MSIDEKIKSQHERMDICIEQVKILGEERQSMREFIYKLETERDQLQARVAELDAKYWAEFNRHAETKERAEKAEARLAEANIEINRLHAKWPSCCEAAFKSGRDENSELRASLKEAVEVLESMGKRVVMGKREDMINACQEAHSLLIRVREKHGELK